ncbi:PD-(D/E)XK nuclease-like domain-containing protein [Escherichia coli]|uniref:RecE family exodeoxyribonuclease n=1 Tax=Escherichia coli TaxID=562 RepID=UPI00193B009A|nr:RecE family exodeoxyribonuclease [Escherichia coli]MBM2913636.1 PD-(D/E)XK nuclease-like domain-containing protein [Escherichia coli]
MSTKPLFLLRKAKKSSGEPDVVLWASDDFESTCATLDYLLVKSGKKLSSYFKPVATNFPVVNDLPPEGEIDFTWSERYQLSKDSITWELKPGAAPDDVHHQEDAPETEEPTGGQEENTRADAHGDCQDCEVSVSTLRFTQRLLHIFTYAAGDRKYLHHATREQREHITALEMDQENSYVQNLLLAIRGMAEPTTLDNDALLRLTDAIKAVFSITKKHQPYEFKNFISAWLDTEHIDRGLLTKEWRSGNRVSRITRTASGANAGGGNDPKWVKGIQTRDSVYQNQPETEKTSPDVKQPEPVVQQEPEIVCNACGQTGGDNCPDCGAVMGDATYQETFDEENQVEAKEKDPVEMEGAEHPHNENAGSDPHRDCSDETGEASAPVATEIMWPSYFEPGRYENLPNEVYHSANGISSTMLKDARISLMYYHGRHIAGTIPNEESDALLRGRIIHSYVLETDKFADEYAIPVPVPEYVVTTSNELIAIIKKHNASLPALMTPEQMKEWIESYNSTLIQPLSVSAGAEETGILYGSLPVEFRRIPEGEKHTASAMKACIKEYNASLPPLLKTSGAREQLLDQIETVDPELAKKERAKSLPYNISGTKEQLTEIARKIRPELVTLEDWQKRQQEENAGKTFISPDMYEQAKNIHAALQNNTDAARLLNHPDRKSEISYFGFDEETGLEIRVRPDIEIRLPYESICADVKSVSLGYVRQERLKDRLHREIIERDYHLSAAMYCDVANLDKFFWIFVNKDAGYHWVAVVEASQELLELGRQEYRRTLRQINEALETNNWPAPITESYTDELNDFDLRRLEALSI